MFNIQRKEEGKKGKMKFEFFFFPTLRKRNNKESLDGITGPRQ